MGWTLTKPGEDNISMRTLAVDMHVIVIIEVGGEDGSTNIGFTIILPLICHTAELGVLRTPLQNANTMYQFSALPVGWQVAKGTHLRPGSSIPYESVVLKPWSNICNLLALNMLKCCGASLSENHTSLSTFGDILGAREASI
jgi:hypothetical protein